MASSIASEGQGSQTTREMMEESRRSADEMREDDSSGGSTTGHDDVASRSLQEYKEQLISLEHVNKRRLAMALPERDFAEMLGNRRIGPSSIFPPYIQNMLHLDVSQRTRSPLPSRPRLDGRPLWEPPILNHNLQIGDEYKKQRETLLKYYEGDVQRTTKYLDTNVEHLLLLQYKAWAGQQIFKGDLEDKNFWNGLIENLKIDEEDVSPDFEEFGIMLVREKDGSWYIYHNQFGRCPTETEAYRRKALLQERRQLDAKASDDDARDTRTFSSPRRRGPRRTTACHRCRLRKMRCNGAEDGGACWNCQRNGIQDCHFGKLRSQNQILPRRVESSWTQDSSPAGPPSRTTRDLIAGVSTIEPTIPMEYQPQVLADEATPLISQPADGEEQAPDPQFRIVLCGWQFSYSLRYQRP